MVLCAVLIRLGHGGDQFAVQPKNLKRTHLRLTSDEIEYRVGILDLIFEALRMIVHHLVCTEGSARNRCLWFPPSRSSAGERDARAEPRRLRRSLRSVDDHRLAGFE